MSKKLLLYIGIGILSVAGILLLILKPGVGDKTDPEAFRDFCENNPYSVICTSDDPTYEQAAVEIFNKLLADYSEGYSDNFCLDYLDGNLESYCLDSHINLLPEDTGRLSVNYEIERVSSGIFDFETKYIGTNEPAWTVRLALTKHKGMFVLTGLSYKETPEVVDLELSYEDVNLFLTSMISASETPGDDFCDIYFTGDALVSCENNILNVAPQFDVIHNYSIMLMSTNYYTYTIESIDGLVVYQYIVLFEAIDDINYISDLEVTLLT